MLGMPEFEVDGRRWYCTYLESDTRMPSLDRIKLVTIATLMYICGIDEKKIETENYEGTLRKTKDCDIVGSIIGPEFKAELQTYRGNTRLRFIVSEVTPGINRDN
ncbi:hypothetical protein HYW75_02005 [Candidatus Pacearchaeota archaeon]|nr:hypothetical protein [Candidatus Pacearchaeota archaeon]